MKKSCLLIILFICLTAIAASSQQVLPAITVKNLNGKIVVSWLNEYKKPIQNILIQRSYDSLKNYSTVGTVLNPQNTENGYPDANPPYNKMYYRITITFEGGTYVIGPATRPVKEVYEPEPIDITAIPPSAEETSPLSPEIDSGETTEMTLTKKVDNLPETKNNATKKNDLSKGNSNINIKTITPPKRIIETAYPSVRVFTSKQNIVVIHIAEAITRKYHIKFFDENEKLVFEVKKIPEDYLYLEKSNFVHSGWFRFEIYEDGILFEKNKLFVGKDKPKP
jgi:hypothetical protein